MTLRVSWGIYRQALALRRKGLPVHRHPDKLVGAAPGTTGHQEQEV